MMVAMVMVVKVKQKAKIKWMTTNLRWSGNQNKLGRFSNSSTSGKPCGFECILDKWLQQRTIFQRSKYWKEHPFVSQVKKDFYLWYVLRRTINKWGLKYV